MAQHAEPPLRAHVVQDHAAKIFALEQKLEMQQRQMDELKATIGHLAERSRSAAAHPATPLAAVDASTVQTLYGMYDSTFSAMNNVMSTMSELANVFRDSMDKMYDLVGPVATAFTRGAAPEITDGATHANATLPAELQQQMPMPHAAAAEIAQLAAAASASNAAHAGTTFSAQPQMQPAVAFGPAQAPFPA